MDEATNKSVSRFLEIIQVDFPQVAAALSVPRVENRDRVRATLGPLSRERLEFLAAFSITYLLQMMGLDGQISDRRIDAHELREETRKLRHQLGALKKLAHDPTQPAKAKALKLWKERDHGQHPELRTVDQFAMECMRRWPALTSISTIKKWSSQWTKEKKRIS